MPPAGPRNLWCQACTESMPKRFSRGLTKTVYGRTTSPSTKRKSDLNRRGGSLTTLRATPEADQFSIAGEKWSSIRYRAPNPSTSSCVCHEDTFAGVNRVGSLACRSPRKRPWSDPMLYDARKPRSSEREHSGSTRTASSKYMVVQNGWTAIPPSPRGTRYPEADVNGIFR